MTSTCHSCPPGPGSPPTEWGHTGRASLYHDLHGAPARCAPVHGHPLVDDVGHGAHGLCHERRGNCRWGAAGGTGPSLGMFCKYRPGARSRDGGAEMSCKQCTSRLLLRGGGASGATEKSEPRSKTLVLETTSPIGTGVTESWKMLLCGRGASVADERDAGRGGQRP